MEATSSLLGRAAELTEVDRRLHALEHREPGCLQIVGEAGIGKTSLLAELCRWADARGHLVLNGRGAEYEQGVPFGMVIDALDDYLGTLDRARFSRVGDEPMRLLAGIFPALERFGDQGALLQAERYRSHHAVRALLAELASQRPLVLALDDLHWADDASVELVSHLLRRPVSAPLLLVLAYRSHQVSRRLAKPLAAALRDGTSTRIEPGPLTREQSRQLIGAVADKAAVEAAYRESGGNPFYLLQLARATHEPTPATAAGAELRSSEIPEAVTAALQEELDHLSDVELRTVRGAAVAGEPFEPELVGITAGLDANSVLDALDALIARDLVRPTDVPRRFRFRHPIVRRTVYEATPAGWRLSAHARAAKELERAGASATARAEHVERSARPGDSAAVELLAQAGRDSAARAPAIAVRWFQAALRLVGDDSQAASKRIELLVPLATSLAATGRLADAQQTLRDVLAQVPPDLVPMRARIIAHIARLDHPLGRHGEGRALLDRTLAGLDDPVSPEGALLHLELAADRFFAGDFPAFRDEAQRAREIGAVCGAVGLEAAGASMVASAWVHLARYAAAQDAATEAAEMVDASADEDLASWHDVFWWLGWAEQLLERFDASLGHFERGMRVCRATGQGYGFIELLLSLTVPLGWRGDLGRALEIADEASEAALLVANDQFMTWAHLAYCWLYARSGDGPAAIPHAEQAAETTQRTAHNVFTEMVGCYLGEAQLEAGEPAEARESVLRSADMGAPVRTVAGVYWQLQAVLASIEVGDLVAAREWVELAERSAAAGGLRCRTGWARRAASALALAEGRHEDALALALEAVALLSEGGDRTGTARARMQAAAAHAAAGDRAAAERELERAIVEFEACDAHRSRDRAARELRRLGKRVARTGRRAARAGGGMAALSKREREVANLVSEGKTNRQIAAELFLSEKTIETHLSKVFSKLGVSSRAAVAGAMARERDGATA